MHVVFQHGSNLLLENKLFITFQASVQFRLNNRDLGMGVSAIDEDLAIFLEMGRDEKGIDDHSLALECDEFDESSDSDRLASDGLRSQKIHGTADDSFLKLETERVGCDWLPKELEASPPPLVKESMRGSVATQPKSSNGEAICLKSELANYPVESALAMKSVTLAKSTGVNSLYTAKGTPLSSGGRKATPKSATPTGRKSLPAKYKSFHPSTTALKVFSKSSTRSATPTLEPSTRAMTSSASAKDQFLSGRKKGPEVSHRTSTFLKTKPLKPSPMRTSSHDTPQKLKTLMPIRAASASQERQSIPYTISLNTKSRQKPYSPSKEQVPGRTHHKRESMMLTRNRSRDTDGGNEVSPILMGSKMVERVVNMRKLVPPKHAEYPSQDNPPKNFRESSGFGRSLSKKSLEMAIRHMDIRRSVPEYTPSPFTR